MENKSEQFNDSYNKRLFDFEAVHQALLKEARKLGYAEGYEAGRAHVYDLVRDANYEISKEQRKQKPAQAKLADDFENAMKENAKSSASAPPKEKSAQELRDEIVEKAKADLSRFAIGYCCVYGRNLRVEFLVDYKKRTVEAILRWDANGQLVTKGIARCAPNDCFNVYIGQVIALLRALNVEVPDKYLNTPQPTEVRVGDVVCGNGGDDHYYSKNKTFTITKDSVERIDDGFLYKENADDWIERDQIGRIIDDSREEAGE